MNIAKNMPAPAFDACLFTWDATTVADVQATVDNAKGHQVDHLRYQLWPYVQRPDLSHVSISNPTVVKCEFDLPLSRKSLAWRETTKG